MNPDGENFEAHYSEYELPRAARQSVEEIKRKFAEGYTDEQTCRDHLNYLEGLCSRVRNIIQAEQASGYTNETLKHDYKRIDDLCRRLAAELDRLDA